MKPEFLRIPAAPASRAQGLWHLSSESDRLTDVLLCAPAHLRPVPCCSATRESLEHGFETDLALALDQHRRLRELLEAHGVRCHALPPVAGLPDLCFTRDSAVVTPWGPVLLNPAMPHRQQEVAQVERYLGGLGAVPQRITAGTIEGGDVCIARDGLAIIGISGERTSEAGAMALAAPFGAMGWEVLFCPFDAYHLHLDTIFCMLDDCHALACTDALPAAFVDAMRARGIQLLDACNAEARQLGCNILSLDGRTILTAAGQDRLGALIRLAGFETVEVEISQFSACGGGLHCLTMPLARSPRRLRHTDEAMNSAVNAVLRPAKRACEPC